MPSSVSGQAKLHLLGLTSCVCPLLKFTGRQELQEVDKQGSRDPKLEVARHPRPGGVGVGDHVAKVSRSTCCVKWGEGRGGLFQH